LNVNKYRYTVLDHINSSLPYFLLVPLFLLSLSVSADIKSNQLIRSLSNEFEIKIDVLDDFISTYDFKCPSTLTEAQLKSLLMDEYADHELSVMIESDRLGWRDTYLEARSGINCLTKGVVSKGY
jgi:hypothetical protein